MHQLRATFPVSGLTSSTLPFHVSSCSEFEPVCNWNLELPNLEAKGAVFLPSFPAYEMTLN